MRAGYAQDQDRWFETFANYEPGDDYEPVLKEVLPDGWTVKRQTIWYVVSHPSIVLKDQGWKIHVSTRTARAVELLRVCLPLLFEREVCFKFAVDAWITGEINGKLWPRGSSGKFITIYPNDLSSFLAIGAELAELLQDFSGPYILSDRRWPGSACVFYRYGGFVSRSELTVEGLRRYLITLPDGDVTADIRQPYFWLPPGVIDPLREEPAPMEPEFYTLKDGRYKIEAVLNFTNRGGVYRAFDHASGRNVIIKEARSLVEIGRTRARAEQILADEYDMLLRLRGTRLFVTPLDFFREWEHHYLVEEHAEGTTLAKYIIENHPIYSGPVGPTELRRYLRRISRVWLQIARAIDYAHHHDIILGDLSINNVMVDGSDMAKIIDLEAARTGNGAPVGLFTPGFTKPSSWETGDTDEGNDIYSLGAVMLAGLVISNNFFEYYPPARDKFLAELQADLDLPAPLLDLIRSLHDEDAVSSTSTAKVIQELERISGILDDGVCGHPRLAVPVELRFPKKPPEEIHLRFDSVLNGIADLISNTADTSRRDRLFPADMLVYATNPLSVAYGACGALRFLKRVRGEVPTRFMDWVLNTPVSDDGYPPGLYLGQAGLAWVLDDLGWTDHAFRLLRQSNAHRLKWDAADVLHGASGRGLASLRFWHRYRDTTALEQAVEIGDWLLETAVRKDGTVGWSREGETEYIGYARGASGIALFLLYLSLTTSDDRYREVGRQALRSEVRHADWSGERFLGFPEEPGGGPSPYWAAGTAGILTSLIRYWAVERDGPWLQLIRQFEHDVRHKYAKFPQLFRGLAGMGNSLLDLWYFFQEDQYIRRALLVAEGVMMHRIDRAEGISFPGDRALRESCDYATGSAGVGMFLNRLMAAEGLNPNRQDVYDFNFTLDEFYF